MDAWFAGFADGEAHFGIVPMPRPAGLGYGPVFAIGLRVDDLPILEALQREFGGSICAKSPPVDTGIKPQARWNVGSKADLARLVAYFDRYPLRSKKAAEYALWRCAVTAYARDGYRSEEVAALYQPLKTSRQFTTPTQQNEPLRLVKEA